MNADKINQFSHASFRCFNTLGYIPFVSANSAMVRSLWGVAQIIAGISIVIFEFMDDFYEQCLKKLKTFLLGRKELHQFKFAEEIDKFFQQSLKLYKKNIQVEKRYAKELIFRGFYDLARARIEMIPLLGNLTMACYDVCSSLDLVTFRNKNEPKNYCMSMYQDFFVGSPSNNNDEKLDH